MRRDQKLRKTAFTLLMLVVLLAGCLGKEVLPLSAPTNLQATPGDGQVTLSWTGVTDALSYKVFQSEVAGGQYTLVKAVNGVSYVVEGLTNDTTYYFVVKAVNADGESGYSAEVSATPVASTPKGTALLTHESGLIDFGMVHRYNASEVWDMVVTNTGDTMIQLTGTPKVQITGPDAHFFFIQQQPEADYLPVGEVANFQIQFIPDGVAGDMEATIEISYRAEGGTTDSKCTIALKGSCNSWEFVGGREFTPAMDLGGRAGGSPEYMDLEIHDGQLYFAFKDQTNPGLGQEAYGMGLGKATVMSYNGLTWENVGDFAASDEAAFWPSLHIYDDGTPYLAYTDRDMDKGGATVRHFIDNSWIAVGTPEFTIVNYNEEANDLGNGAYSDIFVYNDNGTPVPYVAVQEKVNNNCVAAVYKLGTDYQWTPVGERGFGATNDPFIQVVEENGVAVPYVANVDQQVKKYDGQNWVTVGNDSLGFIFDLKMDSTGATPVPYVAVLSSDYKMAVKRFNGTSWESVGTDGFSTGAVSNVSMALENGVPYVAFTDSVDGLSQGLQVMKYTGQGDTGWEVVGNADITIGEEIFQTKLAVEDGVPYVAFQFPTSEYAGENSGKGNVMRFRP